MRTAVTKAQRRQILALGGTCTQRQIAVAVGVSPAVVSLVLNDKYRVSNVSAQETSPEALDAEAAALLARAVDRLTEAKRLRESSTVSRDLTSAASTLLALIAAPGARRAPRTTHQETALEQALRSVAAGRWQSVDEGTRLALRRRGLVVSRGHGRAVTYSATTEGRKLLQKSKASCNQ